MALFGRKIPDIPPGLEEDSYDMRATACMGVASFTILVWDHLITLEEEVKYIWKGKKGLLVWLFMLNRYITPLGFAINIFAYLSPLWTPEVCKHFVQYEGAMTTVGINIASLMMFLRVRVLYRDKPAIIALVAACFSIELGVNAWLCTLGIPVRHKPPVHSCSMVFDDSVGSFASASAFLPLAYDSIVLLLTMKYTLGSIRTVTAGKLAKVILRDGILYYCVIFSVTLVLTIMIAVARPGVQNLTAQLELILTVAMMSRITLHLRKQADRQEFLDSPLHSSRLPTAPTSIRSPVRFNQPPSSALTSLGTNTGDPIMLHTSLTVMHDDRRDIRHHGEMVGSVKNPKNGSVEEWYELGPVKHSRAEQGADVAR
ncbi:hypothetical protein BDW22DRAFT_1353191 [Trametopsis cervina]|nr:hypothetical protein BDW22DRAFT_1353191 [Trametopsis cervina]